MTSRLLVPALACVALAACDSPFGWGEVCTLELRSQYTPSDTTIVVGETFRASVRLSSCGGKKQLADVFTWRSEDTTVVTVDAVTGQVVGRGTGSTRIAATGAKYGPVGFSTVAVLLQ